MQLRCWNSQGFDTDEVDTDSTYILVWNDFNILDMPSRLKDLSKHIFCDSWIQTSNVQCTLVRLGSRATNESSSAIRRHNTSILSHW